MLFDGLKRTSKQFPFSPADGLRIGLGMGDERRDYRVALANAKELAEWVHDVLGIQIAAKKCCAAHQAPLDAFAASYFAEEAVVVWKASRGLGGKTVLLAALSLTEALTLGASVVLLGGSGEQSTRVHDYISGHDTNLPNAFWGCPMSPQHLIDGEPTMRRTALFNGGMLRALMASQRSVRGPHPQRLRLDEADEMDLAIYKAATGQPMDRQDPVTNTITRSQITVSSTWQYPDGTMTYVLSEAQQRKWPVFEWCYRESIAGGWLSKEAVERKRTQVPGITWEVEYELGEPNPEQRLVPAEVIAKVFDKSLGDFEGDPEQEIVLELPVKGARYATGADWARDVDWSILPTYRIDVRPWKLVAWLRTGRKPYPLIVAKYNERVKRYPGPAGHDATGLGKVVEDYLTVHSEGFDLVGKTRTDIFSSYLLALEHGKVIHPYIRYLRAEHNYLRSADLFGGGHPPDSVVASAIAYYVGSRGGPPIRTLPLNRRPPQTGTKL